MKMANVVGLAFLLSVVFPAVLLAVGQEELPQRLFSNEVEASGIYSEDDNDFYSGSGSGSGSGDGFVLEESYFTADHAKSYHLVPSTNSNSPHSSTQITVTEVWSQDVIKDLNTVPVHPNLVFNATTDAIMTSPLSSTTISKEFKPIVPENRANNFLPHDGNTKHDATVATQVNTASPKLPTSLPDHTAPAINGESFTVPSVIAGNEITTMVDIKNNLVEEDEIKNVKMDDLNSINEQEDIFISNEVDGTFNQNENTIGDHQSSVEPPNESYSHEYSTSGRFWERKELLAASVAGGFVGLLIAVLLVTVLVYRMKKKDEGSYILDESKQPNGGYQKPQKQEEFYA
ncbi:syndecan-1-like [Narcine bancroftii]|uniref:syndecan-1-like n=1 Tax=Narcine bancroftii TaxID=1343680 RepID=UPI003831DD36